MGTGSSKGRYKANGALRYISHAQGVEKAEEVRNYAVPDNAGNVRVRIKTYKWSHDGPFPKDDYEPIVYFYKGGENRPKHAISFSHYGYVYHKNLKSWNTHDYSARFPNEFHTPVLKAEKIKIKNGSLSKGAYACAVASLLLRPQSKAEPSNAVKGLPPNSIEISHEVNNIIDNREVYLDELERL